MLKRSAFIIVVVVALFTAVPGSGTGLGPSHAEAYPGADNFTIVGQECLGVNNVRLFMRWTSYQRVSREAAARMAADVRVLAESEGLFAHAAAGGAWEKGTPS